MVKNKLNLVAKFQLVMAFLYLPIGLVILFAKEFGPFLQGGFRLAFGLLLIGYGIARIYMTLFKSKSNQGRGFSLILIFFITGFLSGCANSNDKYKTGTNVVPTIYVDATLEPVIKEEVFVFTSMEGSEIDVKYVPERVALEKLLSDSTSLVILAKPLSEYDTKFLNKKSFYPRVAKIAVDAIAFIANSNCKDSVLSVFQVKDILTGKISKWSDISKNGSSQPIQLVFDNKESSTVQFMMDSVCRGEELGANIFALDNNREVVDYVAKNANAIGIVGVSWISDRNDSLHLAFHNRIHVFSISHYKEPEADNSYKPYQAYMYDGVYAFTRGIYVVNNETYSGLLSSFASFLSGDKGQRILYKAGLFPANAPIRLIQVNSSL